MGRYGEIWGALTWPRRKASWAFSSAGVSFCSCAAPFWTAKVQASRAARSGARTWARRESSQTAVVERGTPSGRRGGMPSRQAPRGSRAEANERGDRAARCPDGAQRGEQRGKPGEQRGEQGCQAGRRSRAAGRGDRIGIGAAGSGGGACCRLGTHRAEQLGLPPHASLQLRHRGERRAIRLADVVGDALEHGQRAHHRVGELLCAEWRPRWRRRRRRRRCGGGAALLPRRSVRVEGSDEGGSIGGDARVRLGKLGALPLPLLVPVNTNVRGEVSRE